MRSIVAGAFAAAVLSLPAHAVQLKAGADGAIDVGPDFGACASVVVPDSTLVVGQFTAVGHLEGPGTRVSTVRAVVPFVSTGSWSTCILGGHSGAMFGEAKFTLTAATATGEYAEVKQCVVDNGALTCV